MAGEPIHLAQLDPCKDDDNTRFSKEDLAALMKPISDYENGKYNILPQGLNRKGRREFMKRNKERRDSLKNS